MSDRILVATRKGLFDVRRGGAGWRIAGNAFLGDNLSLVHPDPRDGTVYAALDHGHFGVKMHRSSDGGTTWEECATPEYPKPPEGHSPPNPAMGGPAPWRLMLVWSLAHGGRGQDGRIWAGTLPGGLFVSDDRGGSWTLVRSLWDRPEREEWFGGGADWPGIHSILVDPRDGDHVLVAVSCGGVWRTRDGGETWSTAAKGMWAAFLPPERKFDENLQDPHQVVRCAADPAKLWCQHHNGVFRSTDDAATWQEIPEVNPSVFGFAVAVHPADGDTAWFVPAVKDEKRIPVGGRIVVARTRDGGRTFDRLSDGLPQENAYDITFRHALDVDPTGDRVAFGSTTGSLWVSDDQGDRWQCVSEHLPPIYCVRFA